MYPIVYFDDDAPPAGCAPGGSDAKSLGGNVSGFLKEGGEDEDEDEDEEGKTDTTPSVTFATKEIMHASSGPPSTTPSSVLAAAALANPYYGYNYSVYSYALVVTITEYQRVVDKLTKAQVTLNQMRYDTRPLHPLLLALYYSSHSFFFLFFLFLFLLFLLPPPPLHPLPPPCPFTTGQRMARKSCRRSYV